MCIYNYNSICYIYIYVLYIIIIYVANIVNYIQAIYIKYNAG